MGKSNVWRGTEKLKVGKEGRMIPEGALTWREEKERESETRGRIGSYGGGRTRTRCRNTKKKLAIMSKRKDEQLEERIQ